VELWVSRLTPHFHLVSHFFYELQQGQVSNYAPVVQKPRCPIQVGKRVESADLTPGELRTLDGLDWTRLGTKEAPVDEVAAGVNQKEQQNHRYIQS